jgi:hypothetical protein
VSLAGGATTIGQLGTATEKSGNDDMEPQDFRERQGPRSGSLQAFSPFVRFYSSTFEASLSSHFKLIAAQNLDKFGYLRIRI